VLNGGGRSGNVEDSKGVAAPRCREASQIVNMSTTANVAKTEFRRPVGPPEVPGSLREAGRERG